MTQNIELSGKLANGKKWAWDEYSGELMIYGKNAAGNEEWLAPCWSSLSEKEQDELSAIGAEFNSLNLEGKAEAWGKSYGEGWFSFAINEMDGDLDEWRPIADNYSAVCEALSNANHFYSREDMKEAVKDLFGDDLSQEDWEIAWRMVDTDGWLGEKIIDAAYDAAYDDLQRMLED